MRKILFVVFVLFLAVTPQIKATQEEDTDLAERSFGCSIEVIGEVMFNYPIIELPIGKNSFIMLLSIQFIDGYNITVKIDGEVIDFDSGGRINIFGFFGIYSTDSEDVDIGKPFVNLNGKAFYVKINEEQNEIDDSYLPIVESLDNITHSLDKSPLELKDDDLESLEYLSDCKIVGLGEATHGTKQFFQLKHRIFKYLVENHDFKIFAFECDLGESYYVDKYVTEGEGDIDDIMINVMHFWTWMTNEVKDLLVWMKEYNEGKSDEDKIHFIGVDCQFLTYQADIIMEYFNQANITLSEDSLDFLNEINQINPSEIYYYYSTMSLDKKEEIDQNVDNLISKVEDSENELVSASSLFEYQFVNRIVLNIKQVNDFYYNYVNELSINRDFYMAENTLWTSDLFGDNTKVALWAHNGHVANYGYYSTGSMGYYLKEELKETYQIIGFAFSFGSFTAIRMKDIGSYLGTNYIMIQPMFGSINYVSHYAQDENFILREIDIPDNSSFDMWISEPHMFLNIGAGFNGNSYTYYHYVEFKQQYDILIYWDTTTASELLKLNMNTYCSDIFAPDFVTSS